MTKDRLKTLSELRIELDELDQQILDLIERRLATSADIAAAKSASGDRLLKLRPARQAEILTRLKSRARRAAPELVEEVWRQIMAHSLQSQANLEIILAPSDQPELLQARVRAHFGSAAPIRRAATRQQAIGAARVGETVAIVPDPLDDSDDELRIFDVIRCDQGRIIAYAVGRVAANDVARSAG